MSACSEHLQSLLSLHGISNVSIRAVGSCVRANGFAAQPLYMPHVNLLVHSASYTSVAAELTGRSGVGAFLLPWRADADRLLEKADEPCDVRAPPCLLFRVPTCADMRRSAHRRLLRGPLIALILRRARESKKLYEDAREVQANSNTTFSVLITDIAP